VPLALEGGNYREVGLASMIVDTEFDSGTLRGAESDVELLLDERYERLGWRLLTVRMSDADIDEFIARAGTLPSVVAAPSKGYVWTMATNDPYWQGQNDAGLALLDLAQPWRLSTGAGVGVAVIDTGVNEIPDLSGKIAVQRNFIDLGSPSVAFDTDGHGTRVAAVIAAHSNNGTGVAGVAPGAHIAAVKACYPDARFPEPICDRNALENALLWVLSEALDGGVQVVNLSTTGQLTDAMRSALAGLDELGVAVVVAAGNDGNDTLSGLAASPDVNTVVGTLPDGSPHPLSNSGSEADVAAPYQTYSIDHINAPAYSEDTSFSAPVISGVLALYQSNTLIEMYRHTYWRDHGFSGWSPELGYGAPTGQELYESLYGRSCSVFDFDGSREIDVRDEQLMTFRYMTFIGHPYYDPKYDIEPSYDVDDGDIDIKDLARVFYRDGLHCPYGE